ncbi:MAG TPA: DUF2914 domain-containing protein [Candidatus Paceibacterota bacterium]
MNVATIKIFFKKHERHLSPLAFLAGFILDNFTLTRVDALSNHLIFLSYLTVACASIILYQAKDGERSGKLTGKVTPWLPLIIQFTFGGLFSGFLILYSRSASLVASWPFLLFLVLLFIGSEVFKHRYSRLPFQLSVLFLALLSYTTFLIPVLAGHIGADMFILSGVVSLVLTILVIMAVKKTAPSRFETGKKYIGGSITGLFILFNLLYFANLIPPLPLSIKDIGVYHYVAWEEGKYHVEFEPAPWYAPWKKMSSNFHRTGTEAVYVLSSVFAPTRLNTTILHRWSYLDEDKGRWVPVTTISYPITGGSEKGYRGYSLKENVFPGTWRVDVITERGQVIGRIRFDIKNSSSAPTIKRDSI